jgi:hypothetical protein
MHPTPNSQQPEDFTLPSTKRLTAATAPRRPVSIVVAPAVVCTTCFISRTDFHIADREVVLLAARSQGRIEAVPGVFQNGL